MNANFTTDNDSFNLIPFEWFIETVWKTPSVHFIQLYPRSKPYYKRNVPLKNMCLIMHEDFMYLNVWVFQTNQAVVLTKKQNQIFSA